MNNSSTRIAAGMVLYNSDYERLLKCLDSLNEQVELIIAFDNSPQILEENKICKLEENYQCKYIYSGENLGMPEALNRIMQMAKNEGYEWVLTMNPDSIVPSNMMGVYSNYFNDEKIGMICPQVIDKRRKYMKADMSKGNQFVHMCITSAACTRIKAWKQVGEFDGWLFVDLLDNDISKRMILNGWKILQINLIVLDQEFGDILPKGKKTEQFWIKVGKLLKNDNFAKFSYKKIVHPNRVYYTCRNILYLNKKFQKYGGIGYKDNYNCHTFVGFLICFVLPSILRADKKRETFNAVVRGFKDGKRVKVVPWERKRI